MKQRLLTVRMDADKYLEFRAAAEVRGIPMSALVTQFAFQVIREVKKDLPAEFEEMLAKLIADKTSDGPDEFVLAPTEDAALPITQKGGK